MKTLRTRNKKSKKDIPVIERRHFIRHPIALPLVYQVIRPGTRKVEEGKTRTINAGLGGLLFPSKYPAKPGDILAIKMPFEDKTFSVKAKVVRCSDNPQAKVYDIAVSFFRLYEAFKVKMIEQIYLISEYRDLLSLQEGREVSMEEASQEWIKRYSARFKRMYW